MKNYLGFNALNSQFGSDVAVLAFPCAQFMNQEPGDNGDILNGLKYVRPGNGYVPAATMFQLTNVNGLSGVPPLYDWMKNSCPPVSSLVAFLSYNVWSPIMVTDIQWNFEKFLFNRQGQIVSRWGSDVNPADMASAIKQLLTE